jgi:hypothetical protein
VTHTAPDRDLSAEISIKAPPTEVWSLISDVRRLPDWSPELVAMLPLKRGGLRVGQWYLGINRRKAVFWPTRNVVGILEEGRRLAWDTTTSGARWIWQVTDHPAGCEVRLDRPVPKRIPWFSGLFTRFLLGGESEHADELEAGMAATLTRLKSVAEA